MFPYFVASIRVAKSNFSSPPYSAEIFFDTILYIFQFIICTIVEELSLLWDYSVLTNVQEIKSRKLYYDCYIMPRVFGSGSRWIDIIVGGLCWYRRVYRLRQRSSQRVPKELFLIFIRNIFPFIFYNQTICVMIVECIPFGKKIIKSLWDK